MFAVDAHCAQIAPPLAVLGRRALGAVRSASPPLSTPLSTSAPEKSGLRALSLNERIANTPITLSAEVQLKIHMGDDERVHKGNRLIAVEFDFDAVEWRLNTPHPTYKHDESLPLSPRQNQRQTKR